jgi:hypothetical protein
MAHKVCPTGEIVDMAGKAMPAATVSYCTQCGHPEQLHAPKCTYTSYGQECDCKHYHR